MRRWITLDDINDTYGKLLQRGWPFIRSKFSLNAIKRTQSAFSQSAHQASNWWHIPEVTQRWNEMITGDPQMGYKPYLMNGLLKDRSDLSMISFGCGEGTHELEWATYSQFKQVVGIDVAPNRIETARSRVNDSHLANVTFDCKSMYSDWSEHQPYDVVFFNASLHHFKDIPQLLDQIVLPLLKKEGLLIINEYVGANRLQFPKQQITAINKSLRSIPKQYRKRYKRRSYKNKFYGSGWLRMYIADPSECVDAEHIIPAIHQRMEVLVEKPYGGNLLMNVLKDIAYHFVDLNQEKEAVLKQLFKDEDQYIALHNSDFVFGVYEKK